MMNFCFPLPGQGLGQSRRKWIYFIKHAGGIEYIPETLNKEPGIKEAFDIANTAGLSEKELELQDKRRDFIWLQKGSMEKAFEDGEKKKALEIAANV